MLVLMSSLCQHQEIDIQKNKLDLDIVDYLKYPLVFWMILKACVVISFGN